MTSESRPLSRLIGSLLWGNSIALSWMWGLGLFFSVQFTIDFGLRGLLFFALFNCLGLFLFGFITHQIAKRSHGSESLAKFFQQWSRPFRLAFFLYQLLAITLTIFALIRYAWQPLGLEPNILYLPLTALVILMAGILFGEEFNIRRIKYSHGVLFLFVAAAIGIMLSHLGSRYFVGASFPGRFVDHDFLTYAGYVIPICIGFLIGPWLDLQQWQRAVQIHRENISITSAYFFGAILFGALLLFHGVLGLWAFSSGAKELVHTGIAGYAYSEDLVTRILSIHAGSQPWFFGAYLTFLAICILTTLDSGYIALRWFLKSNVNRSNHPIFSLIPSWLLTSPIIPFVFCALVAVTAAAVGLELEYFMIFFATFFVGYEALSIGRAFMNGPVSVIPQVKMFCIGSLAVVIFSFGYLSHLPLFQILSALMPLGYVVWLMLKPMAGEDFAAGSDELDQVSPQEVAPLRASSDSRTVLELQPTTAPTVPAHSIAGHFEGKWFVHTFIATYADTNSVGNVYFGMYAMWVGKTRELFFNQVMPKFNLRETPYYILTRSFEHKFVRETREFETVTVRIRVASYNRKFVTLEHEIADSHGDLLGKGSQSLLFVSSTDYKMLDIPQDIVSAFISYA
ncbi:MAG: acyl-CoA thioesterase [Verrucomicrobia bacterium]|nr:acyl-CoA thioesterase [Verrucomicrobiota bacterium]